MTVTGYKNPKIKTRSIALTIFIIFVILAVCVFFIKRHKMLEYGRETALLMETEMNNLTNSAKQLFSEIDSENASEQITSAYTQLNQLTYNIMTGIAYKNGSDSYVYFREKDYLGYVLLGKFSTMEQFASYGHNNAFFFDDNTSELINKRLLQIYRLQVGDEGAKIPTFYSTGIYTTATDAKDYGFLYIPLDEEEMGNNYVIVMFDREKWLEGIFRGYDNQGYGYGILQTSKLGKEIIFSSTISGVQEGDVEINLPGVTWELDIFPIN